MVIFIMVVVSFQFVKIIICVNISFSLELEKQRTFEIFIAMGLGSLLGKLLSMTGISFPSYFGSLICAIILRNVTDAVPKGIKMHSAEINQIGSAIVRTCSFSKLRIKVEFSVLFS